MLFIKLTVNCNSLLYRTNKKEIKEHINDFKKTYKFFVSRHKFDHDYMIDWRNAIILDSEQLLL